MNVLRLDVQLSALETRGNDGATESCLEEVDALAQGPLEKGLQQKLPIVAGRRISVYVEPFQKSPHCSRIFLEHL